MKVEINHLTTVVSTILILYFFSFAGLLLWLGFFTLLYYFRDRLIYVPRNNASTQMFLYGSKNPETTLHCSETPNKLASVLEKYRLLLMME